MMYRFHGCMKRLTNPILAENILNDMTASLPYKPDIGGKYIK